MSSSSGSIRSKFWKNAFKPKKNSGVIDSNTGGHISQLRNSDKKANSLGLSTIFQSLDGTKVVADIVFLHGLTGGSSSTWYNEQHDTAWPRDFLGQDLKNVRIFTFGYDADVANWWNPTSQNRIGNNAEALNGALNRERRRTNTLQRKLIFVTHSLGGLVVKNAMTLSKHSPDKHLHSIEASTSGIAFMGTPHFGSDLARWGSYATNIARVVTSANKEIVSVLRPDSEMLSVIQKDFGGLLRTRAEDGNPLSITCFFEEHRVKLIGEIVPKHSAIIPGFSSYGIQGNHMTMTQFPHRSDNGYQTVLGELERWVEELTETVTHSHGGQTAQDQALQQDCLRSLYFPNLGRRQESMHSAHANTVKWIWRDDIKFQEWLAAGCGLYWITGKPGCGKSTLLKSLSQTSHLAQSFVIDHGDREALKKDAMVVTHFFDYKGNELERSMEGFLRSLLFQILRGRPSLFDIILPKFQERRRFDATFSWTTHDLQDIFYTLLQHPQCTSICVLVDALDEYDGEDIEIAEYIDKVSHLAKDSFCFCVSSRPYPDFAYQFKSSEGKVSMDAYILEDIRSYCSSRFASLAIDAESKYKILIDLIVQKADRVFLWVKLVIDDILRGVRRKESLERLLQRVDSMPTDLVDFYERMIQGIREDEREEVNLIISIVAYSKEILSIEECHSAISHSLLFSKERLSGSFSLSASLQTFGERVEAISCGLVEVTTIQFNDNLHFLDRNFDEKPRNVVKLSHQTVSEFLNTHNIDKVDLRLEGHLMLFMACIHSIMSLQANDLGAVIVSDRYTDFRYSDSWNPGDLLPIFAKDPFLNYAVSHWIQHAKIIDTDSRPLYFKIMQEFSGLSYTLYCAVSERKAPFKMSGSMAATHLESRSIARPATLLELAIICRLNGFVMKTLDYHFSSDHLDLPSKNLEPIDEGRLLYGAATGGNVQIAEYLFANGVKIDSNSRHGSGALARAIYRNNLGVARALLEHGADLEYSGMYLEGLDRRQLHEGGSCREIDHTEESFWLQATPTELGYRARNRKAIQTLFDLFDWSRRRRRHILEPPKNWSKMAEELADIEKVSQWPVEIAIDDFDTLIGDEKETETRDVLDEYFSSDRTHFLAGRNADDRRLRVLDDSIRKFQDGGSIRYRTPEIIWDPQRSIEDQISLIQRYIKGLGRRPLIEIPLLDIQPAPSGDERLDTQPIPHEGWSIEDYICSSVDKAFFDPTLERVVSELGKLGYTECECWDKSITELRIHDYIKRCTAGRIRADISRR